MARPIPPSKILDPLNYRAEFVPASELTDWIFETFLSEKSSLYNPEHDHLNMANIGCLWTNQENSRHQRNIVATAELGTPPSSLGKWAKARWIYQVEGWFGEVPDFILTFYAPVLATASDLSFCATVEHEILHCGQALKDGFPVFNQQTGKPKYAIVGHDVEEHVSIMRRYGVEAGAGRTKEFVAAANRKPEIGRAKVLGACGNCLKAA